MFKRMMWLAAAAAVFACASAAGNTHQPMPRPLPKPLPGPANCAPDPAVAQVVLSKSTGGREWVTVKAVFQNFGKTAWDMPPGTSSGTAIVFINMASGSNIPYKSNLGSHAGVGAVMTSIDTSYMMLRNARINVLVKCCDLVILPPNTTACIGNSKTTDDTLTLMPAQVNAFIDGNQMKQTYLPN